MIYERSRFTEISGARVNTQTGEASRGALAKREEETMNEIRANKAGREELERLTAQLTAAEAEAQREKERANVAEKQVAHLRKVKDCYYDCVDKREANQRIAEAQEKAMEIARPMVAAAEAEAARLRAALEAVEWVRDGDGFNSCPWCTRTEHNGHKPDCQRQAALTPAEAEGIASPDAGGWE